MEIATIVIGWPEWIKKYVLINLEIKFSNSCLLWQTLLNSEWFLLKKFKNRTVNFSNGYPLPARMSNKWFNCHGEWFRVVTCSNNSQWFSTNDRITILDGTLLNLCGILTIEKGNEALLSKRPKWPNFPSFPDQTFHYLFWCLNPKTRLKFINIFFTYNRGNSIVGLFDVLLNFSFTTSETKHSYY